MLLGAILGALIVFLIFYILFLLGQIRAQKQIIVFDAAKLAEADGKLQHLAARVQALQQPYEIKISDEQSMRMANALLRGVERLYAAENTKLN